MEAPPASSRQWRRWRATMDATRSCQNAREEGARLLPRSPPTAPLDDQWSNAPTLHARAVRGERGLDAETRALLYENYIANRVDAWSRTAGSARRVLGDSQARVLVACAHSVHRLQRAASYGGLGRRDGTGDNACCAVYCEEAPTVLLYTLLPVAALCVAGALSFATLTEEMREPFERVAAGALLHVFVNELFGKWSVGLPDDEEINASGALLRRTIDDTLRTRDSSSSSSKHVGADAPKPFELLEAEAKINGHSDELRTYGGCHGLSITLVSMLGFAAAAVLDGVVSRDFISSEQHLAVENAPRERLRNVVRYLFERGHVCRNGSAPLEAWANLDAIDAAVTNTSPIKSWVGLLLPYYFSFASDGLVLAYDVHTKRARSPRRRHLFFTSKRLLLAIVLSFDNVLDGIGIVSQVDRLLAMDEGVSVEKYERGSVHVPLFYVSFAATITVTAQAVLLLRVVLSDSFEVSAYVHSFLRFFGLASIASSFLQLSGGALQFYVLVGFLSTWAVGYLLEQCVDAMHAQSDRQRAVALARDASA